MLPFGSFYLCGRYKHSYTLYPEKKPGYQSMHFQPSYIQKGNATIPITVCCRSLKMLVYEIEFINLGTISKSLLAARMLMGGELKDIGEWD